MNHSCSYCSSINASYTCGHQCDNVTYCNQECANKDYLYHEESCLIGANAIGPSNYRSIKVDLILGEGSFGCVLRSTDRMYAIKVQETRSAEKCNAEGQIQQELGRIPYAAVAKVYFYSANIENVPSGWRNTLLSGKCEKAKTWAKTGWKGNFCITVMDFLPGGKAVNVSKSDMPAFCFSLVYTLYTGYKKIGFQHLDIKVDNVTMIPVPSKKLHIKDCPVQWKFDNITSLPRIIDFGLSRTNKLQVNAQSGTLGVTPPEVLVKLVMSSNPAIRYERPTGQYHRSFDLYSVGLMILNSAIGSDEIPYVHPLIDSDSYMNSLLGPLMLQVEMMGYTYGMILTLLNVCVLNYAIGNEPYPKNQQSMGKSGSFGFFMFGQVNSRNWIDYICVKNSPTYEKYLRRIETIHGKSLIELVKTLIQWDPEKRVSNIINHSYFEKYKSQCGNDNKIIKQPKPQGDNAKRDRNTRLDKFILRLYHQTSPEAANAIVKSQQFRLGKDGFAGGGIYFALTPEETDRKAHVKGVILTADVRLGRVAKIHGKEPGITAEYLAKNGIDSIYLVRPTGSEYVVYYPDQVKNISIFEPYISLDDFVIRSELETTFKANEAGGVMFLITGIKNNKRVILLGRELGGSYKGQYNMFGGRHDKTRRRIDTALAEYCEEFGASAKGGGTQCDTPKTSDILNAKKIFAGVLVDPKVGPHKTTIIILWNLKEKLPTRGGWNANNAKARANAKIPKSYKEMDRLQIFDLTKLMNRAHRTPKGQSTSISPITPDDKHKVIVSMFTLQTLRDVHTVGYL